MSVDGLPRELKEFVPSVTDESGRPVSRPDVMERVVQLAQLAQLARIRQSLERETLRGQLVERTLSVTGTPGVWKLLKEYPHTPLPKASFTNDGPNTVYISINDALDWQEIKKDGTYEPDFTKADRRIEVIHYKCDRGNTASLEVKGKY